MLLVKLLHDLVYSVFVFFNKSIQLEIQDHGVAEAVYRQFKQSLLLKGSLDVAGRVVLTFETLIWNLYYVIKHVTASLWHIIIFHEVFIWITLNSISILQQIIKERGFWFSVYSGKIYLNSWIKEIKKENFKKCNTKNTIFQNTKVQRMFLNEFFFYFSWFFFYFSWCVMINCKIRPANVKT